MTGMDAGFECRLEQSQLDDPEIRQLIEEDIASPIVVTRGNRYDSPEEDYEF